MDEKALLIAAILSTVSLSPLSAYPAERAKIVPIERESVLDTIPLGTGEPNKLAPEEEKVGIEKEGISDAALLRKKDPLVMITEPRAGVVSRSYQKVSCRVGGGIAKAFLRINDDTQIVTVKDGTFEAYGALRPGLNGITVLAWDLEGNIGKDSLKVFCRQAGDGPKVEITKPGDNSYIDITEDRVITVEAAAGDRSVTEGVLVLNNIPRAASFEDGVMKQELALLPGQNEVYVECEDRAGRVGRSNTVRVNTFDARPKDLAAVLTWDSMTEDFDLHVWDSFGHHTFNEAKDAYQCDAAIPGGKLDMDRKGFYGPEVFSLEYAEPEVYTFYAKYSPGLKTSDSKVYLRLLLHGDEPSRRIMRSLGPVVMGAENQVWEAAHVKMPEGVFFQEKDADLLKTLGMDRKAVRRLSLMLEEENPAFRLLAISAMGQIKSEEAVGPLLKALSGGSPEIRRAAAGALWNIKSLKSVDGLVKALRDEDPEVRRAAAGALGNIGDKKALTNLTGLLGEETDPLVRVETIKALGRLSDARAYDSIASQAHDPDPRVRVESMRALGNLGEGKAQGILVAALEDNEPGVREVAAWALGRLCSGGAVRQLMDVLHFDDSDGVRVQAAVSLGRIKDLAALDELADAVRKDPSPGVRFCAAKAIEGMTAAIDERPKELPPVQLDEDVVVY